MTIRQLYQKSNIVQTRLAVEVMGIRINYYQLDEGLKYEFNVACDVPFNDARQAVLEVVGAMESQSFDHGAQWRRTSFEEEECTDPRNFYHRFKVGFRVRDSY